MEQDENGNVIPQTTETKEVETSSDELDSITDIEELRKRTKGFRSMASRYKTKAETKPEPVVKTEPEKAQPLPVPNPFVDIVTVFSAVKDLTVEEIDALSADARDLGVEPLKYMKSAAGTTRLTALRAEKKSKDAAPDLTSKSTVFRNHTAEDLKTMSVADLEKIIPK